MKSTAYSMNLSDRYVPEWGAWEVLREIIANAIDADAKWELQKINNDHVEIFTSTVPKMGHLLVIGGGTKNPGDESIGQFGEGFKLAALACVRSGGTFLALTPGKTMEFDLRIVEELGENILYCEASKPQRGNKVPSGCVVRIQMRGIGTISLARFLDDRKEMRIDKDVGTQSGLTLYVKGVWICDNPEIYSLYNWNLTTSQINRDRAIVDLSELSVSIGNWYDVHANIDNCLHLLEHLDCFEMKAFDQLFGSSTKLKDAMVGALHQMYGDKICMASLDDRINEWANLKGYKVLHVFMALSGLLRVLKQVPTADSLYPKRQKLTRASAVDVDLTLLDPARKILRLLNITADICVFQNEGDLKAVPGQVEMNTEGSTRKAELWVNEKYLADGQRSNLLAQVLSLASSVTYRSEFGSLGFEADLVTNSATLAEAWLDATKEKADA